MSVNYDYRIVYRTITVGLSVCVGSIRVNRRALFPSAINRRPPRNIVVSYFVACYVERGKFVLEIIKIFLNQYHFRANLQYTLLVNLE